MNRFCQLFIVFCSLGSIYVRPVSAQTWDTLLPTVRKRFPHVAQLGTAELAAWLADTNRPAPVLLDVRSEEEYAVSHLPHAHRAEDLATARQILRTNRGPVVVYCSVGYRSSALADKLRRAGETNVQNLEGSIFKWANEGRKVYQGEKPVQRVHPYSRKWGRLLERRYHP